MNSKPSLVDLAEKVQSFAIQLGGVFRYSDLVNLIGSQSELQSKRLIRRLIREKVLIKVQRGFYVTAKADLWVLACQLRSEAYISMDSVLAKNGLIGTVPAYSVSAVYSGQGRKIVDSPLGTIRYFSMQKAMMFGTQRLENGITVADSEKAFLDLLYYYMKGGRFVIDPLKDVSLWKLDRKKVKKYLVGYRNVKFVKFAEGLLREI